MPLPANAGTSVTQVFRGPLQFAPLNLAAKLLEMLVPLRQRQRGKDYT